MTTKTLSNGRLMDRVDAEGFSDPPKSDPGGPAREPAGSTSALSPDTWIFFPTPHPGGSNAPRWGLGFGPIRRGIPRWSLFHCVTDDRFDARVDFPHPCPSDRDLLGWSTSVVGPVLSVDLLESVGSCSVFYRQYFSERPDLRG
jgi:hypothetical protein